MPAMSWLPSDMRTLGRRYAVVTMLRIGWGVLLGFSFNGIGQMFLTSPLTLLSAWNSLFWRPSPFVLPVLVSLVLATIQFYLVFEALRSLLLRWRPELADRFPEWASPAPEDGIDSGRLERPGWLPPVLMTFSIVLTCYAAVWLALMLHWGRPVPLVFAFRDGGTAPLWIGLAFGVAGLFFGYRFSSGARATVGDGFGIHYLADDDPLSQRVHALADKLDLPRPQVGVVDVVNAFAMGRNRQDAAVALGLPLVHGLAPDELDAVIGHELGHIASADMQRMQFAAGYQRMFGATIRMATTLGASSSQERSTARQIIALGALLHRTVMVGSEMLLMWLSRTREFHADAVGAALTSPAAMIGALEKLHALPSTPTPAENRYGYLMARGHGRLGRLFSTHPTLEQRRRALTLGRYMAERPGRRAVRSAAD